MAYSPPSFPYYLTAVEGYTPPSLAVLLQLCLEGTPDDIEGTLAALLPLSDVPLTLAAVGLLELELWSDVGPSVGLPLTQTRATALGLATRAADMRTSQRPAVAPHTEARSAPRGLVAPQTSGLALTRFSELLSGEAIRVSRSARTTATEAQRTERPARLNSAAAQIPFAHGARAPLAERIYTRRGWEIAEHQQGQPTAHRLTVRTRQALTTQTRLLVRQTEAMWPLTGRYWPRYTPPPLELILCCVPWPASPGGLVIAPFTFPRCSIVPVEPGPAIVPVRRLYYVLNVVSLTLLDGTPVPSEGLRLSLDCDSWAWSWSVQVPGSSLPLVYSAPGDNAVELLATVNGVPIRLRVESIQRARSFASSWLTVSGRGRAAVLASPTAASVSRTNTAARTAQQLLEDALTVNGVPIGWALDWQIEDWQVPAGAWSHTGTYIEAAARIAQAAGGYVQGHDTAEVLRILPYYPAKPWEWAETDPEIVLPEDACSTEGIEWIDKVAYDSVWITGGTGGRRDRIVRTGSAGTTQAQTIVDDLATDVVMTRQRGIRVLGDTGRQALITVRLPVLPEVGLIHPGQLVRYTEHGNQRIGMSRSISVEQSFPEVWQTIKLESHES